MNPLFGIRQFINAAATTSSHLAEDRVFFAMQVARRLPPRVVRAIGGLLSRFEQSATQAASAWLLGREERARTIVRSSLCESPSRLLGEIALNLGLLEEAASIASAISDGRSLSARIAWTEGDLDSAINAAPPGARRRRLDSERRVLSAGWWPTVKPQADFGGRPENSSRQLPSALHVLTNSLPHTRSGYAYRSHLILSTLQDAGHSVLGATRPSYPVTIGKLSSGSSETIDGIRYLRNVPMRPATTPEARLSEQAAWISAQARDNDADILHTTTHYVNGLVTGAAARASGLPWVYEVRGVLEETWAASGSSDEERRRRRSSQRFVRMRAREIEVACSADAVITLGQTMKEHLVANGVSSETITVIPNSVSDAVVSADVERRPAAVRAEMGLPSSGIWVGTAASIVGYEGLDGLVDAVSLARSQGVDIRLLVAGDGIALPALREKAEHLGENAVFVGRVSATEAIEYQLALDAIVVPRKDEPVCRLVTPIKPVEAMGLGRPVIVSDLPALRELVPRDAGRHVQAGSAEKLAEAVVELAGDDDLRQHLGENGRAQILATRRWRDIGTRYSEVYSRIMRERAR
ncbi:glycosyltransferase family 4 protein [Brevibacterium casei]|uniref:glycosyltransferase family 4 protein n=3 Tax=Brevibacterium casei TaxID=33889 RepID=UPI0009EE80B8|nr:glycosyltransferase family 4 protein [Brevibacterium casei]